MNKLTVKDVNVKGKKVLVRCDFNVPMKDGKITDENRIMGALPTIKYLVEQGAKVILCSHMGKPHSIFSDEVKLSKKDKKKVDALPAEEQAAAKQAIIEKALKDEPKKLTLKPVADRLNELLGGIVTFATDVVGEDAKAKAEAVKEGEIVLLENLRFHWEEEKKEEGFCKKLADLIGGENGVYVNDAFGTAHRSHASTAAIVEYGLVKTAVCGFLIEKELSVMADSLENPVRPFVAILGGAKVADKLNVINNLLEKCDTLIIGGGMSYTFLKAKGYEVGTSLVDDEKIGYCKDMMEKAEKAGKKLLLPIDAVITKDFPDPIDAPIEVCAVDADKIPADMMSLDIGPKTRELYATEVANAKTVIWNGPMGVFENPILAEGTKSVAKALADAEGATTIIGGGDSAAAVQQLGFAPKMSHISTGGGASLELFEGKTLPGIACLNEK
ncbi:MAG: phosphoglycerate kinase [Clostridia bacterium]|nr:phosphoglycerate kinase [Clostridia bacterium]